MLCWFQESFEALTKRWFICVVQGGLDEGTVRLGWALKI